MKIFVKAKTGAREEQVVPPTPKLFEEENKRPSDYYLVSVKERPIHGRANVAITRALAQYFKVSVSQVNLISGVTSKVKTFEIDV